MAASAYAAYAGLHDAPDGHTVCVVYCNTADNKLINHNVPPAHRSYRRYGWYWWVGNARPTSSQHNYGPFTSSRLAYQDAMKQHAPGKRLAAVAGRS